MAGEDWTWVHYKLLELAYDETRLPELCGLHEYRGFPPWGKDVIPATTLAETRAALADLVAAGAVELVRTEFVSEGALVRDVDLSTAEAVAVIAGDAVWDEASEPGWQLEVVPGEHADALFAARPPDMNPHRPARVVVDEAGNERLVEVDPPPR